MSIKSNAALIVLLHSLLNINAVTEPVIPFVPKPDFDPSALSSKLPHARPEQMGVSSSRIYDFLKELNRFRELDMHGVTVLRDGVVIGEYGFGGYDRSVWQLTYSECKSITSLAIGMLIDEGRLSIDENVADIFGKRPNLIELLRGKRLTVRNLLTMTGGAMFCEPNSAASLDWISDFLESAPLSEPGKKFIYNSLNTYMLSAIVHEKTGSGLTEYLTPRLFEPLGINQVYWERCPAGIEKGGWGLFIRPMDLAKIGQLVMDKGVYGGRRLISENWITQATTAQVKVPPAYGNFDYGFQIWCGRDTDSFLFNGMFGQNVIGWFKSRVLLVTNAGSEESFQQGPFYGIAEKYFSDPSKLSSPAKSILARARDSHDVRRSISGRNERGPIPLSKIRKLCRELNGKRCERAEPSPVTGLYPFIMQATQNNFSGGVTALGFEYTGSLLYLTIEEKGARNRIPVGIKDYARSTVEYHGEHQLVAAKARFGVTENGDAIIGIRISFLEVPSSRLIKLTLRGAKACAGESVRTVWSEKPGSRYLTALFDVMKERIHSIPGISLSGEKLSGPADRLIDRPVTFIWK